MDKIKMTTENVKPLIEQRWTQTQIGKYFGHHPSTVCVKLKAMGLKTKPNKLRARENPVCKKCGDTNPANFLKRKGMAEGKPRIRWWSWCKRCAYDAVVEHKAKKRAKIVAALGGKCVLCGFSKYIAALDAHHLVPSAKAPNADQMGSWSLERIEKELKFCVLLCSNCHRGFHNNELPETERILLENLAKAAAI